MIVQELINILQKYPMGTRVIFSIANDSSVDDTERWFVNEGVYDYFLFLLSWCCV